jgi:hypothetical protein
VAPAPVLFGYIIISTTGCLPVAQQIFTYRNVDLISRPPTVRELSKEGRTPLVMQVLVYEDSPYYNLRKSLNHNFSCNLSRNKIARQAKPVARNIT